MNLDDRDHGVFDRVEDALAHPEQCRVLELTGDEFRPPEIALPDAIGTLVNLERLQLDLFGRVEVPAVCDRLVRLERVAIDCAGPVFPSTLLAAPNLRHLDLTLENGEVPDAIGRANGLVTLRVSGVRTVGRGLGRLRTLRSLALAGNAFRWLPEEIADLTALRELDLSYSAVAVLPKSVTRLHALEVLDIGSTFIDELPLEIANLKRLRELRFSKPFEHHGPEKYRTRVKQIRQSWCALTALRTLDLRCQNIIDVSGNVRRLEHLEELDLGYNEMDEVPEELFGLANLRRLDLSFNRLTEIVPAFARFTALESLSLIANPIASFAPLHAMTSLRELDLRRVPIDAAQLAEIERALPDCRITTSRDRGGTTAAD